MRQFLHDIRTRIGEAFWFIPALMVVGAVLLALGAIRLDRTGLVPPWLQDWLYDGGGTGARTLLAAVASSAIAVAGTVFSITIAALSLAAGQMGPRLLRNFTHDRGNQVALGVFLATFSYALMVLRSIRTQEEGVFVPHLSMTVGMVAAAGCVATLIYFVGHMAALVQVDTVIGLVGEDLEQAIARLDEVAEVVGDDAAAAPLSTPHVVHDRRRGYLTVADGAALADALAARGAVVRLLVRPGDYVFPGAPIALASTDDAGVADAIVASTTLSAVRVSKDDLEYAVRQLVEIAVRALSPGINDPVTAVTTLDRFGAALCELSRRRLPGGRHERGSRCVLALPAVDYDGLTDAMFHLVRQNGAGSAAVLIRLLDVLAAVASCERDEARLRTLRRHADLVVADGEREIANEADVADLHRRAARFEALRTQGPAWLVDQERPR